jgi:hypothetical protein
VNVGDVVNYGDDMMSLSPQTGIPRSI